MGSAEDVTLIGETRRVFKEGGASELGELWRHEGLKTGVEIALDVLPRTALGRFTLGRIAADGVSDNRLSTSVATVELASPYGIGAGWDKKARTLEGWQILGAGFVVPGAVNLFGQSGNDMVRLRTFDSNVGDHGRGVSLNAMGFNSPGTGPFVGNFMRQVESGRLTMPVFPQITLNKEFYEPELEDVIPRIIGRTIRGLEPILPHVKMVSLGLSSPNTKGMRDAQVLDATRQRVYAAKEALPSHVKLEYKGDGDGGDERLDMYCKLVEDGLIDVISLVNTTSKSEIKAKYGAENLPGGLAGKDADYQSLAEYAIQYVYEAVGDKVDIIGLGGAATGSRVLRMIELGASAVATVSSIPSRGIRIMPRVKQEILADLDAFHPGKGVSDVIGSGTQRGRKLLGKMTN